MFLSTTKKPTRISKQLAHKALSGSKGYLSSKAKKALSKSGISLNKSFTKRGVQKACKILQEEGEMSRLHTPTKIARKTLKEQEKQEKIAKDIRTKKFAKSYLAEELAEERAELLGKIGGRKTPKLTLSEELKEEQEARGEKKKEEEEKRKRLVEPMKRKTPISQKPGSGKPPPDILAGM